MYSRRHGLQVYAAQRSSGDAISVGLFQQRPRSGWGELPRSAESLHAWPGTFLTSAPWLHPSLLEIHGLQSDDAHGASGRSDFGVPKPLRRWEASAWAWFLRIHVIGLHNRSPCAPPPPFSVLKKRPPLTGRGDCRGHTTDTPLIGRLIEGRISGLRSRLAPPRGGMATALPRHRHERLEALLSRSKINARPFLSRATVNSRG